MGRPRQRTRELVNPPEFAKAQQERKRWKPCSRNSRIRSDCVACAMRRLKFVREQFFLAAVAQNIKRLVRCLGQPTTPLPLSWFEEELLAAIIAAKSTFRSRTLSTPTPVSNNCEEPGAGAHLRLSMSEVGRVRAKACLAVVSSTMKGRDDLNTKALLRCSVLSDSGDAVRVCADTKPAVVRQRSKPKQPRYGNNRRTQEKISGCEQGRIRGTPVETAPANLPVDRAFRNGPAVFCG
jgi:hypothetical protein